MRYFSRVWGLGLRGGHSRFSTVSHGLAFRGFVHTVQVLVFEGLGFTVRLRDFRWERQRFEGLGFRGLESLPGTF